jgi:hypothetical protein
MAWMKWTTINVKESDAIYLSGGQLMEVFMGEVLSFETMQRRYDGEWLLIVHTSVDENSEILAGEVWAHSPDVNAIYQALSLAKGIEASIEYMGKVPADFAAIL